MEEDMTSRTVTVDLTSVARYMKILTNLKLRKIANRLYATSSSSLGMMTMPQNSSWCL
jgi:hypothetical protein